MAVAKRCGAAILDGKPPVSLRRSLLYWLGNVLIYGPLKQRPRHEPHPRRLYRRRGDRPDLFRFYRSIGINLKQLYGQTETCAYVCLQPDGQVKPTPSASRRRASR
jgi:long-chain acyl-CoA synthetase